MPRGPHPSHRPLSYPHTYLSQTRWSNILIICFKTHYLQAFCGESIKNALKEKQSSQRGVTQFIWALLTCQKSPRGFDQVFIPPLLGARLLAGNWAAGGSALCSFAPNNIVDTSKVGLSQGVGTGAESVGTDVSAGVRFYMSGFCFHQAPLCNHCSAIHTYWKGRLCFQEISLNWAHQNLKVDSGRASVRWSQQTCCDLKGQCEETTLSRVRQPGDRGPETRVGVCVWSTTGAIWDLSELDFFGSWLDSMTFRGGSCLLHITCFESKKILSDIYT